MSMKLTPAAATSTTTSPESGVRDPRSTTRRTCGPPSSVTTTARMDSDHALLRVAGPHTDVVAVGPAGCAIPALARPGRRRDHLRAPAGKHSGPPRCVTPEPAAPTGRINTQRTNVIAARAGM